MAGGKGVAGGLCAEECGERKKGSPFDGARSSLGWGDRESLLRKRKASSARGDTSL